MKKLIIGMMLTIAVLCLAACGGSSVKVGSFSSLIFDSGEYDDAVQEVFTYFDSFEGCTMTEIGYAGDDAVRAEAKARGLAPEQVMVLTSKCSRMQRLLLEVVQRQISERLLSVEKELR